jgi:hypothetical protein
MKNFTLGLVMSFAIAGAASAQIADGAARTIDPAARRQKLAELDAWLQRLVGRFRIEGFAKIFVGINTAKTCIEGAPCYSRGPTQGAGDCKRVGTGPGVHCAFNIAFLAGTSELWRPAAGPKWPGPFLGGAMVLYGIDTESMRIRFLLVDAKSIAYEAFGILEGDWMTFRSGCVNDRAGKLCKQIFRIRAKSDESSVEMRFDKEVQNLTTAGYLFALHRLPAER